MISSTNPRRSGSSLANCDVTFGSPYPKKPLYGSTTLKLFSSWSIIGLLQCPTSTASSTPSPSRSAVCGANPGAILQVEPNCFWMKLLSTANAVAAAAAGPTEAEEVAGAAGATWATQATATIMTNRAKTLILDDILLL